MRYTSAAPNTAANTSAIIKLVFVMVGDGVAVSTEPEWEDGRLSNKIAFDSDLPSHSHTVRRAVKSDVCRVNTHYLRSKQSILDVLPYTSKQNLVSSHAIVVKTSLVLSGGVARI